MACKAAHGMWEGSVVPSEQDGVRVELGRVSTFWHWSLHVVVQLLNEAAVSVRSAYHS